MPSIAIVVPWALPNLTRLCGLLLEPLVARGELSTIHNSRFGNIVSSLGVTLLFAVRFLGALNRRTRLRRATLGVKGYAIGLIPPNWYAVSIPVLKNVVRLE